MGVLLVVGHAFTIKSSKSFSNEGSSEKTSAAEQLKTLGQAHHGAAAAEARKSFSPKPFKVRAVRYSSSGEHKWSSSKKLIHFVRHGQGATIHNVHSLSSLIKLKMKSSFQVRCLTFILLTLILRST